MSKTLEILRLMSDGTFHSGQTLGAMLGISRAAVWNHLQQARALGLPVHSVPGRGHRLAAPLEFLDTESIRSTLGARSRALLGAVHLLPTVDSTNRWMLSQPRGALSVGSVCLAEHQSFW